ncbi:hypothetical protein QBC44DRAFT_26318 [Cladorrhinum sp. PSN332]|nr:hypothetical protein QBC44DRAFT_26318 [Cladorrhinum sp. PSN332]
MHTAEMGFSGVLFHFCSLITGLWHLFSLLHFTMIPRESGIKGWGVLGNFTGWVFQYVFSFVVFLLGGRERKGVRRPKHACSVFFLFFSSLFLLFLSALWF